MAGKMGNLQNALNRSRGGSSPSEPVQPPSSPSRAIEPAPKTPRQANRQGKVNLSAWLAADFKASLRLIQARRPASIQQLMEEAFNDLFAKYDVPTVSIAKDD